VRTNKVVWAAGIKGVTIAGIPTESIGRGNRILVDAFCRVKDMPNVFAVGDVATMEGDKAYPNGHPQVAPVAMQQAELLVKNLKRNVKGEEMQPFSYNNQGSMATVGRNRAVVDLKRFQFQGFFAWVVWMFVHLISIIGMKNRLLIFINWAWNYVTFDQSLRLMIRPKVKKTP
jgi:NADH dehydrogenase